MKTRSKTLLICLLGSAVLSNVNAQSPTDPGEAVRQRITKKVERVKQGAQKWAASGRDPSAILKAMQEKVGPLLDSGKAVVKEKVSGFEKTGEGLLKGLLGEKKN